MSTGAVHVVKTAADAASEMAAEVREGLLAPRPWLPCKYFYDERGSALFEEITRLPEYYPTRTEEAILEEHLDDMARRTRPLDLVELGSGTGRKTRTLLDALGRVGCPRRCTLVEISEVVLEDSVRTLSAAYPAVEFGGVAGDFLRDLPVLGTAERRLLVLFAGTIGNLHPRDDLPAFLRTVATVVGRGGAFLVGIDLVKDVATLEAAYDDSAGVTAEFNRNILRVVNGRLGADFAPEAWRHVAFYDRENAWIEMRLRAESAQRVRVPAAGLDLRFPAGAEIRTEISAKYTRASFEDGLRGTGLAIEQWYTDAAGRFASALCRA